MAKLIPWSAFEAEYAQNFSVDMGAPAKSFRMALGALIIGSPKQVMTNCNDG